jgi:hypothetical protein
MPQCPRCAHHLAREHRGPLQRLIYKELFECMHCSLQVARAYPGIRSTLGFIFSSHTHCLQCGNANVQRLTKKDRIETVSRHPLSILFGLTGAPLHRCPVCRVQYRDWRRTAGTVRE